MLIDFCRFPADLAARYRARGYWIDEPLTRALDELTRATPEAIAVIDGDRQLSYRELSDAVANLADRLRRDGLGRGDTAVVQLPNCAEFIITFHALLRAGIVPVNAIYSHRQLEMGNYIQQLKPALLIGDHAHELFATGDFLEGLTTRGQAPRRVILKMVRIRKPRCRHGWPGPGKPGCPPMRPCPMRLPSFNCLVAAPARPS